MTSYDLDTSTWTDQPRVVATSGGRFGPVAVGDAAHDLIADVATQQAQGFDVQVWALVPVVAVDDQPIDPPPTDVIDRVADGVIEQGPGAFMEVLDNGR